MQHEIKDLIVSLFQTKNALRHIGMEDNYFDLGVSSLTIIGLQLEVEEKLGVTLDTRELMSFANISQWIDAYADKVSRIVQPAHEQRKTSAGHPGSGSNYEVERLR
jgi:acyl carrier protein